MGPARGPSDLRSWTSLVVRLCYYQSLIEHKTLPGPNPAADLRYFIGKQAHRKRTERTAHFTREEAPQLVRRPRPSSRGGPHSS